MAGVEGISRRGLLGAAGLAGVGALAAACGGGGGTSGRPSGGGSWAFTDDRGKRVARGAAPKRLVAYIGTAAALTDFGVGGKIVGVFGPTKGGDGRRDPLAGDVDIRKVASLGSTFGEFNVEKYAELRPDLLVTHMFQKNVLWYVPDKSAAEIAKVAPSVGVTVAGVPLLHPIERYEALAASLGADVKSGPVAAAKTRFQKATKELRAAAKANPDITVMAASASPDALYVSDPKVYPDLTYYRRLGVRFVVPKADSQGFFEALSWENADKYGADLILLDSRTQALQPKQLTGKPTWQGLPAVKAGQITPWLSEPRYSYAGCAPFIESLAKALRSARKVR
ncbi:MAG TPA: ABC transporter substrate-binding protein [Streptosporangiaceae bacterium]|jgi:iron complex transport system substrate-binding protein